MVTFHHQTAREVLSKLDFEHKHWESVSKRTNSREIREAFVQFLLSFFIVHRGICRQRDTSSFFANECGTTACVMPSALFYVATNRWWRPARRRLLVTNFAGGLGFGSGGSRNCLIGVLECGRIPRHKGKKSRELVYRSFLQQGNAFRNQRAHATVSSPVWPSDQLPSSQPLSWLPHWRSALRRCSASSVSGFRRPSRSAPSCSG